MVYVDDISSLTDFQRNTKRHLKKLKTTGRPEVLTVNGKPEVIVQDARAFQEMLEAIKGIKRGLDEMAVGEGQPAEEALEEIRAKYKIPRKNP